ncbi:hypothetical protein JCM8097_004697 [Rhodosporidiobolus ruineniae]
MPQPINSEMHRLSDRPARDYLSELPVEVLTDIFELAYVDRTPIGPLSRALLPFDRVSGFERVKVDGPNQLVRLAKALEGGGIGQWVKRLEVQHADKDQRLALSVRQFKAFFAALSSLTHLDLDGSSAATLKLVLSNTLSRSGLHSMTHLAFHALDGQKNPFEPTLFSTLSSYTSLRSLTIRSNTEYGDLQKVKPIKKKIEPLPKIEALTVISDDFTRILPILSPSLQSLELRVWPWFDDYTRPCDSLFSRFTALEHLYLGEGTFSPTVLGTLRSLSKLASLGFGEGAYIDYKELKALVDGPTRMEQLKKLTLDIVEGQLGWKIDEHDGELHPNASPPDFAGPGWRLPQWSDPDGTFWQNGIKVEGKIDQALEVEVEFMVEEETCLWAHYEETGDDGPLRDRFGDAYIDIMREFGSEFEDEYAECRSDWDRYEGESDPEDEDERDFELLGLEGGNSCG